MSWWLSWIFKRLIDIDFVTRRIRPRSLGDRAHRFVSRLSGACSGGVDDIYAADNIDLIVAATIDVSKTSAFDAHLKILSDTFIPVIVIPQPRKAVHGMALGFGSRAVQKLKQRAHHWQAAADEAGVDLKC